VFMVMDTCALSKPHVQLSAGSACRFSFCPASDLPGLHWNFFIGFVIHLPGSRRPSFSPIEIPR